MRLTNRCIDLLTLLRAARWLTTSQVQRRFFSHATPDATRKRLRKLTEARYLVMYREHRMAEALFTLGREGKRVLEKRGSDEITLERKPPKQWEHFTAVNDVRIAAELSDALPYFFACWELPSLRWKHTVIPDAIFSIGNRTFAVEFDRGFENLRFFVRTKIPGYERGLDGFPLSAILIVSDRKTRMEALAKAIDDRRGRFLFTTIDLVRKHGILAPIFCRNGNGGLVKLL